MWRECKLFVCVRVVSVWVVVFVFVVCVYVYGMVCSVCGGCVFAGCLWLMCVDCVFVCLGCVSFWGGCVWWFVLCVW